MQKARRSDPPGLFVSDRGEVAVRVDGDTRYVWRVSTGASGYSTPRGNYKPFRMEREHYSKEWDDAPMPHSIFFTSRGHAIHGSYHTKRLGQAVSHGCVRLAPSNAATLFKLVQKAGMRNTTVVVKRGFDFGFAELEPPPMEKLKEPFVKLKKAKKPKWMSVFR